MRGKVVLFDQEHGQATTGCVTRNADPVDSAAHDQKVVLLGQRAVRCGTSVAPCRR